MAHLAGKSGSGTYGGTTLDIDAWTLDTNVEVYDDSSLGDNDRTFITGIRSGTGTIAGSFDASATATSAIIDAAVTGTAGSAVLTLNHASGNGYSCDAIITGVSLGAALGARQSYSANFQVSGAIADSAA